MIPIPANVVAREGTFTLDAGTSIHASEELRPLAEMTRDMLRPATGLALPINSATGTSRIELALDARADGDDAYLLHVRPQAARITARAAAGLFRGLQTFRQLLPAAVYRRAVVAGVLWSAPCVEIADGPRFGWRGSHIDVSRHFMPKEWILKHLDLLAMHKLNVFHWHLTDDQGWRIEIKGFPKLTEVGAWRKETMIGGPQRDPAKRSFDGKPHGGFYTQDDVREIVAYAQARFVTVVPEIEMPGHSQAAIAAYPELGTTNETVSVWGAWGVSENLLSPDTATIRFYQDILTEVMALFPSRWIHVGGDEAVKTKWQASARVQARIKELGLADEHALQSWFISQMDAFLTSHGRALIGWDEILEGGLAPNAVVMSWRGTDGGIAAAQAGHDVVMTPGSHTYFDHYQSLDTTREPLAIGGFLPLDTVYSYEPVPDVLTAEQGRHVLGAQGQLWTEYVPDPKQAEYMVFPRLCALAEVVWTPRAGRDFADFSARLAPHLQRLSILDVNYRRP